MRDRKIPKATRRNEHKCWFAPFLDFLLDRHPRDRSGRPQAYAYVVGIAAMCLTAAALDWYRAMQREPLTQPMPAGGERGDGEN